MIGASTAFVAKRAEEELGFKTTKLALEEPAQMAEDIEAMLAEM